MPENGYIQVHTYASKAQIPLSGVAVSITDKSGSAIALRLTNRSGTFDTPVVLPVPSKIYGESPNTGVIPYTTVNLYARLENYELIEIENLQVFPNTVTVQDLEMIPLAELPDSYNGYEIFPTPPQNL